MARLKLKSKHIGLIILLVVMAVIIAFVVLQQNKKPHTDIIGALGGEKTGLYENEELKKGLIKDFNLTMDYKKDGSFAMVQGDVSEYDYLFPSSQLALEKFQKLGGNYVAQDIVFNSPIVLYTRKAVADKFVEMKLLEKDAEGVFYIDMSALAKIIAEGTSWESIDLDMLYGNVLVDTTDPNESNSGNMFLGLLANSLNNKQVVTNETLPNIIEDVKKIYQQIGHMQTSSSDMFRQYLNQGLGAYPIIAGYESQILEYSKQRPEIYAKLKDDLVVMYPKPTVWASHVYIALNEKGELGLEALRSEAVQKTAWKDHGFRTIAAGTANPEEFSVNGIPSDIATVMPMPNLDVMEKLMAAIK